MVNYALALEEYDCVNKKYRPPSTTIYDSRGNTLHTEHFASLEWDVINPDSVGEILKKIICSDNKTSKK
jgi:hypothetical protein